VGGGRDGRGGRSQLKKEAKLRRLALDPNPEGVVLDNATLQAMHRASQQLRSSWSQVGGRPSDRAAAANASATAAVALPGGGGGGGGGGGRGRQGQRQRGASGAALQQQRQRLPAWSQQEEIAAAVSTNQVRSLNDE